MTIDNEVMQTIKARRSTRKFTDEQILPEHAMADCALALENIFLAAQSLGLGSCYINQLYWLRRDDGVRDYLAELGIPREHIVCSSAAVGFIDKASSVPPRKNRTINIIR